MVADKIIWGKNISLRPVEESDAEFILPLRLDPLLSQHLNPVSNDINQQKQWIRNQRDRANDFYFIIQDKNGKPIGTVGIYDINTETGTFNWGRWIIIRNAPMYTAIETTILVYHYAFEVLGLNRSLSDVRTKNINVVNFHLSYGGIVYKVDSENIYYYFNKSDYNKLLKKFKAFHSFLISN